ncbi:alpha/beta fold hydrolase [Streptomyces sp. WZ-12]|uniref:alpha/beta fold hydrolase n=1 Tax=Streptomyces sp. WZ-12 TaxID=3030210 RepID=UPI00238139BD|nr:alpha/beta hydrolase [Streptomyces sp. WZ-12]
MTSQATTQTTTQARATSTGAPTGTSTETSTRTTAGTPAGASNLYDSEAGAAAILGRYQEVLDGWPVPAEQVRVPTRHGETFVVVTGPADAPPVLLLHGSGANASMWRDDITAWSRHFRTYAVDLIGEPGYSAPTRLPLASEGHADWLDDVLAALGVDEAAVVATSLGGWLALDYANRRPERVTRLALLCPGGVGRQRTGWLVKALLLRALGPRGVRRSAQKGTGLDAREFAPVLDTVVLTFTHFTPRMERLPTFSDAELGRLAMPVLTIVGGRDVLFDSAGTARRMRACVPHAQVRLLPEHGHALLGQTATVLDFLRS